MGEGLSVIIKFTISLYYGNIPIILYKKLHDNLTKNILNLERNILIYNYRNTPDTKYRKIMNEIDVEKILKKYCIDNNLIYVNFYCNNYTLKERIELFRKAKIVVAPHGGANYHIYFSSKYTKFIEFIFVKDCHSCQLQALSFDLDYWQIPISDHGQFEKIITIDTNALNSLREILEK